MPIVDSTLWAIARSAQPDIDPHALAAAIEEQAAQPELDYRT